MTASYLTKRDQLQQATRKFFRERGFLEVTTPAACDQVIPERHIEPVRTADGRYLQASPEMEMKRLLCGGSGPIFQICTAFRDDEQGPLHRPEFTMVEWYRPGDDMQRGMDLLAELVQQTLATTSCTRTSYRDAFARHAQIDPFACALADLQQLAGDAFAGEQDRGELLNAIFALQIEPQLGAGGAEILYFYPADQAALAGATTDAQGAAVAERFELFYRGVELANGYHELTDAAELRQRLVQVNAQREADGRPALPLPEALLADMASPGLPPCAGVALGFDRLLMLAMGADSIGG